MRWKYLCVLCLALGIAACSAEAPSQNQPLYQGVTLFGAAPLPNPCALLTLDEVTNALGGPIQAPVPEHELLDAECTFATQAAPFAQSVVIALTATGPNSASFEQRVRFFQREGAQPLADLGQPAYINDGAILTQKTAIILFVIVTNSHQNAQTLQSTARQLTRLVLSRLP
jgi:hypothetical protein